tara:strand:- start:711 stop:1781 length:1071 start_codon:yes stop_codon:yes gene_type:complete
MKVSILGNGLTSLTLAKLLTNQGIKVDIFLGKKFKKFNKIQTLGISKSNIDFFNQNILNINKFLWKIDRIEIYNENLKNEKILDFESKTKSLFSIIRNFDIYNYLLKDTKKNKLIKFKKEINCNNLKRNNYKLIFNCDSQHSISKKFFNKKIKKNYNSFAHISILKHKKIIKNNVASQIFTKNGPLAFLPISSTQTSVVYSAKGKKNVNFDYLIKKYNTKYKISKIYEPLSFELKSSNLRSYYHGNIIAFGDLLHKLHPLAGQGFNMTLRDLKKILELINFKKDHGLEIDTSICSDFEKNTKSNNYLFSNGIDFIYEFFNFENKLNTIKLSKLIKYLGKKKLINNFFTKFADNGIT